MNRQSSTSLAGSTWLQYGFTGMSPQFFEPMLRGGPGALKDAPESFQLTLSLRSQFMNSALYGALAHSHLHRPV
jgi:hypothetical protein